jgi:phage tail-like protein
MLRFALAVFLVFVIVGCDSETSDTILEDDTTVGIPLAALMADASANGNSIHGNYNFIVEIDGITVASFNEALVLEAEVEIIEYRDGGQPTTASRKLPGRVKYSNLVLKRGVTGSTELFDWFKEVVDGTVQRRNISVVLMSNKKDEVARWLLRDAWPCRYKGPSLNGLGNRIAIEELEIAHEGLTMEG